MAWSALVLRRVIWPSSVCRRLSRSVCLSRGRDPDSCDIQIRLPEVSKRQAKIEKTTPLATVPAQATWAGAVAGTNAAPVPASPESLKRIHATAEDEVVKVKLNTGTLYLYKGFIRRAVFVRRY